MSVYYIDPVGGKADAAGLTPADARLSEAGLEIRPGDSVLFRRGVTARRMIGTVSGEDGAPVTYGAYGEGEKPLFLGSVDVSSPDDWEAVGENLWRMTRPVRGDVGNFVFNDNDGATLRWVKEDLHAQGDFWDSRFGCSEKRLEAPEQEVLLWSEDNPADVYDHIECVPFADRCLARLKSNIIIEDIAFANSGVHALPGNGENIIVRRCDFRFIGGCVWNYGLRIRFGNAIELWNIARDVTVEDCSFKAVYDSCVTHQGNKAAIKPAERFICRNNLFDTYGMAAFEYRDLLPMESSFTDNICLNAGTGFAMYGETLPRKSEIWPQPMGHHIFLWRIDVPTDGGSVEISRNYFGDAPVGAAIYSIICPEAEAQMTLDNNIYDSTNEVLLNRFGGVNYPSFDAYRDATGQDANSRCEKTDAASLVATWESKR
ncbi:MAG: hypothetical protein IJ493_04670 [Clostridia bacterium]|nr:hypothetical protein [Clostridia bacterium]